MYNYRKKLAKDYLSKTVAPYIKKENSYKLVKLK